MPERQRLVPGNVSVQRHKTPQLECLLCQRRYSFAEIKAGNYFLETMICAYCYRERQRAPRASSCFGKPGRIRPRQYGYNPRALECSRLCPDREVCGMLLTGKRDTV